MIFCPLVENPFRRSWINTLCTSLRGCGFHATPAFICNILKGDLYIDVLITELFQICLVVSQTPVESTHLCLYSRGRVRGVSSAWWQVRTALRFALWYQWQEGTMYGTLSYFLYLWDLDKREQKGVGNALKSSVKVAMQATKGGLFLQGREAVTM